MPIVQEDDYGCAVACVANVLGIPYLESLVLFGDNAVKNARNRGFYCNEIVNALAENGLCYEYKYLNEKHLEKLNGDNIIVYLKKFTHYPAGHFLCKTNGKWCDSWINFPDEKRKSGVRKKLPGKPIYIIYPCGDGG